MLPYAGNQLCPKWKFRYLTAELGHLVRLMAHRATDLVNQIRVGFSETLPFGLRAAIICSAIPMLPRESRGL
ncbi:hypothetical protein ColKHC_12939 [Colletotrichum higginsianum]|nr:hypothetical protein ColKHC_12939 [Colletotrichum higginsianum]